MSHVEILPAKSPFDFLLDITPLSRDITSHASNPKITSPSSPFRLSTSLEEPQPQTENQPFLSLPPLLQGHPEVHLRAGIINASCLAAENIPNAEKAFFVADLAEVYRQHTRWKASLPEIQPFYAVKCNPDPFVLRLLAALGTGFDCASNGEISQVLSIGGIEPSRIIFANPCKAVSFVRNAARMGVKMMTFDNTDELYKIARVHPDAKLVVRILTDDSKSLCAFGIKFGIPLEMAPGLLAKAKELGLDVVGVSFHVGSGCYDPSVYRDAILRARRVFEMGRNAGYTFTLLDVGGGFEDSSFEEAATVLMQSIEECFPDRSELKIIAEPGRFMVSKAFKLACNIIARRGPPLLPDLELDLSNNGDTDNQYRVMYYINDGVYGAFNCIMFDHQIVHPYVLSLNGSFHVPSPASLVKSSVWGPTCDSIDCVSRETLLPSALQVGDWLGFDNMGAYTVCAASQFNGFEVSKVVYTTGAGDGAAEVLAVLRAFGASGHGHGA